MSAWESNNPDFSGGFESFMLFVMVYRNNTELILLPFLKCGQALGMFNIQLLTTSDSAEYVVTFAWGLSGFQTLWFPTYSSRQIFVRWNGSVQCGCTAYQKHTFRKSSAETQVPYHGPKMTLALRNSGVGCSSMTRVTSGCISWSCACSVWLWHLSSLVPFQLPCQSASLWDRTVRMTMSSAAPAICKSARRIFCTNWILYMWILFLYIVNLGTLSGQFMPNCNIAARVQGCYTPDHL